MAFKTPEDVAVAYTIGDINAAVAKLLESGPRAVGLDCEWKPNFTKGVTARNRIALIQISTETRAVLAHVASSRELGPDLRTLLADVGIAKVGCGILDDARFLRDDFGATVTSCIDLGRLAQKGGYSGKLGLAGQCLWYGHELPKPKQIQLSNWNKAPLSERQIRYATDDAAASLWVFKNIYSRYGQKPERFQLDDTSTWDHEAAWWAADIL